MSNEDTINNIDITFHLKNPNDEIFSKSEPTTKFRRIA